MDFINTWTVSGKELPAYRNMGSKKLYFNKYGLPFHQAVQTIPLVLQWQFYVVKMYTGAEIIN